MEKLINQEIKDLSINKKQRATEAQRLRNCGKRVLMLSVSVNSLFGNHKTNKSFMYGKKQNDLPNFRQK